MSHQELGPRDEERFAALAGERRDYLLFLVEFCQEILKRRPVHIEALICAADALTALGYYEGGLALDRRLRQLRPDDPVVNYNLACSLALTGQSDAALAALAEAIRLGYNDFAHLAKDPDLATIRHLDDFQTLWREAQRRIKARGEACPEEK